MPIDPERLANAKANRNPGRAAYVRQQSALRSLKTRGSTQLGIVPVERTVADAFRQMLEVACKELGIGSDDCLVPTHLVDAAKALAALRRAEENDTRAAMGEKITEPLTAEAAPLVEAGNPDQPAGEFHDLALSPHRCNVSSIAVRAVPIWNLLEKTWLGQPAHGGLALKGKAMVELAVCDLAMRLFPRLRSRHLQFLLQQTCGLYPCCRIATRLGLVAAANVETDVGLWRELNKLMTNYQTARKMSTLHKERAASAVAVNQRWYWRSQLRAVGRGISEFPATEDDLRPRVEWLRSVLFSFVAFVHAAEGEHRCNVLIQKLFCPELARFQSRKKILAELRERGQRVSDNCDPKSETGQAVKAALEKVLREYERHVLSPDKNPDAAALARERVHPMNSAADAKLLQRNSTAGSIGFNLDESDVFETFQKPRHGDRAPDMILHAVDATTANSYKEVQVVLDNDPSISPALQGAVLDVEQTVEREVDLHETHRLRKLQQRQQFKQSEKMRVRLFAGPKYALGEGLGSHLEEAIHNAGMDMLLFYYSRRRPKVDETSNAAGGDADDAGARDGAAKTCEVQSQVEESAESTDGSDYFF
jgi:hypothetical protein